MSEQKILTNSEYQINHLQPQINPPQLIQPPSPIDISTRMLNYKTLISSKEVPFWKELMQNILELINSLIIDIKEQFNINRCNRTQSLKMLLIIRKTHNQNKINHYLNQTQQQYQKKPWDLKTVQNIFQKKLEVIKIINVYKWYPMATSSQKCFNMPESHTNRHFIFQKIPKYLIFYTRKMTQNILNKNQILLKNNNPQLYLLPGFNNRDSSKMKDIRSEIKALQSSMKKQLERQFIGIQENIQNQIEQSIKNKFNSTSSSSRNRIDSESELSNDDEPRFNC